MTKRIEVVIASQEERYVRIGEDKYALVHDVARGPKYAERYGWTRAEIEAEDEGPIVVEFEIEVQP